MNHAMNIAVRIKGDLNVYCKCGWADPNPWHGIGYAAEMFEKHLLDSPADKAWEDDDGSLHCGTCGAHQAEWQERP